MKRPVTIAALLVLASVGVGLALVNPSPASYEQFAVNELTAYLKSNVCPQAPTVLGKPLTQECKTLIDVNRVHFRQLIAENTQQQNFLIFSIYKTELSVSTLLPAYKFETIAGLGRFYIYNIQQL